MDNFTTEYRNNFFLVEKTDRIFSNKEPYYRIVCSDSVVCCVLDNEDNIIFVQQYRPNLSKITLELPSGFIDQNELPIDAALREFKEETGLDSSLISLGTFRLNMNRFTNQENLYFGYLKSSIESVSENGIEICRLKRGKIKELIKKNKIEQLICFSIFSLISIKLNIDFFESSYEEIIKIIDLNNPL